MKKPLVCLALLTFICVAMAAPVAAATAEEKGYNTFVEQPVGIVTDTLETLSPVPAYEKALGVNVYWPFKPLLLIGKVPARVGGFIVNVATMNTTDKYGPPIPQHLE